MPRGEEIPRKYDYGISMSAYNRAKHEIFDVRFYPFMLLEEREKILYQLPLVTVTLEPSAGELRTKYYLESD